MSLRNDNLEAVLVGWVDAQRRNDVETIARHLHPDVVWQGLRPDLFCGNREAVLNNVRGRDGRLPDIAGIDLHAEGDQVLFGVQSPDLIDIAGEELHGQVYDVFTIADGLIVRMDEYRTRDEALTAMRLRREALEAHSEPVSRTPPAPVDDLIPFVKVTDVDRSVAFYELLGFAVTDTYRPAGRLQWAALEHERASLMLERVDDPVEPARQGVLFYLYTEDLVALQRHLRAHSERAGQIVDGTPGPREEMLVRDPDGYVLMIAQRDEQGAPQQ